MAGRNDLDLRPSDAALAAALRALPESAPQPDLWPEVARVLGQGQRQRLRWRYAIPVAIAAAIALAVLLPRSGLRDVDAPRTTPMASTSAPDAPQSTTPVVTADELAQLHQRSRSLERWVAAVAARAPQDGRDLMAAVEVEDLIGLVDIQLGGASGDADTLPLWRQRVALLEDLAAIRGNAFALAENGASAEAVPASLDTLN
jgi:hypothetical protein